MYHFLQLLKAVFYTVLIIGTPTLIATNGHVPSWLFQHPAYQFAIIFVFAYAAAPVFSDFLGHHAGTALFFPNSPNLNHPTISHILTLLNKRLYKEALEELRMLTETAPTDFRAYKMLLTISAVHLPDQALFEMCYRKGMQNLLLDEEQDLLKRYRDELIAQKQANGENWTPNPENDSIIPTTHFYVNRKHHRAKAKTIVNAHSATLPPREIKELKVEHKAIQRNKRSKENTAVVPHHFHPARPGEHHAPSVSHIDHRSSPIMPTEDTIPTVSIISVPKPEPHHFHQVQKKQFEQFIADGHTVVLERSGDLNLSEAPVVHEIDNSIAPFVDMTPTQPQRFKFIRPR